MSQARETILGRVRTALKDVPDSESPEDVIVDRSYRTVDESPRADLIKQFIERVSEYRARVRTTTAADLSRAIAEACSERGIQKLVVPADLPDGWAPAGLTLAREPGLTIDQLETSDGVLTACALGIAQTGTVALDSGPGQGRRAITLLPDYHLCVIFEHQIVGLVPEAVAQLEAAAASPDRPITFISGPSATSDIELNRVEGVHGPRTLEVIIVTSVD